MVGSSNLSKSCSIRKANSTYLHMKICGHFLEGWRDHTSKRPDLWSSLPIYQWEPMSASFGDQGRESSMERKREYKNPGKKNRIFNIFFSYHFFLSTCFDYKLDKEQWVRVQRSKHQFSCFSNGGQELNALDVFGFNSPHPSDDIDFMMLPIKQAVHIPLSSSSHTGHHEMRAWLWTLR